MNSTTKLIIKVVIVCAIYIPVKFILLKGRNNGFLADFLVAFFAFAIAHGVIYLIEHSKSE